MRDTGLNVSSLMKKRDELTHSLLRLLINVMSGLMKSILNAMRICIIRTPDVLESCVMVSGELLKV